MRVCVCVLVSLAVAIRPREKQLRTPQPIDAAHRSSFLSRGRVWWRLLFTHVFGSAQTSWHFNFYIICTLYIL